MAPKKKTKELKRRNNVTVKLTDIELELLSLRAEKLGISRAGYLRELLLDKPLIVRYEIVAEIKELRNLVGEFGKIGSNLNQIARYFHTGGARSLAMEEEIHRCISMLFSLRKEVLRMAGDFRGRIKTH